MKNRLLALKEMVDIINRYKRKELKVLGYSPHDKGYYEQFYNLVADRVVETDEEAAKKLMNAVPKDRDYRRVKNEFKKRLINSVFFIDIKDSEFSDAQKAYYNCWKYLAATKILLGRGARNAGIEVAQKGLEQSMKYGYTTIAFTLARLLKYHFGVMLHDEKKWHHYKELVLKYQEIMLLESKAEIYYEELMIPITKSRSKNHTVHEKAKAYVQELEPLVGKLDSIYFHTYFYFIKTIAAYSIYDYPQIISSVREAVDYFENHPSYQRVTLASFLILLVTNLTILKNYEEAEINAIKAEGLLEEGTPNWYDIRLVHISLKFHSGKYEEAYDIFNYVVKTKGFEKQRQMQKEIWKMQEGYFHLLLKAQKIDLSKLNPKPKPFKLQKFLNQFQRTTKDKQGMNIPIQILHILFLLFEKDFDKAEDRIHSLGKYASRHITAESDGIRTSIFIQMLQKMSKANFQEGAVIEECKELLDALHKADIMLLNQNHEVEYFPYDDLWGLAMQGIGE